jgi:ribonuclease R
MYRAYIMRDQVGEQFEGTISAVTSFGAFVELPEPYVEGLIKLDSLGEPFEYDEMHMRLSGKHTGRTLELGDKVMVEINNVSVIRRRIDFTLIAIEAGKPRRAPKLEANPKAGIAQRKKAGREAERAVARHTERGAPRRNEREGARASSSSSSSRGGSKPMFGVSHRGLAVSTRGAKSKTGKGKPGKRR